MRCFKLTADNDLALDNSGRLIPLDGAEAAAQILQCKFLLVLGEWFLDRRVGVPYFTRILTKNPDIGDIRRIFISVIRSEPTITEISELTLDFDRSARTLAFTLSVKHDSGATIVGGSGSPFRVE